MPEPPRLLDQVRNLIRLKHMSNKTERAYVGYIREFILFHGKRHPREMGVDEIREYLSYLAVEKNVAASTQNVALNAILFLYKKVLEIELAIIDRDTWEREGVSTKQLKDYIGMRLLSSFFGSGKGVAVQPTNCLCRWSTTLQCST